MSTDKKLHIAVGVVSDADGRILISERKAGCAYAGQWEFPGGKCEPGEDVESALARELQEELGIQVQAARPLIRLSHRYPDRHVLLDTWRVMAWLGRPEAREGQRFDWVPAAALDQYPMLAANRPILRAAQLPASYLITPEPGPDQGEFLDRMERSLIAGARLLRLRAPALSDKAYETLARSCLLRCHRYDARLLLDRAPEQAMRLEADGLHLTSVALARHKVRPIASDLLLAASCHSVAELEQAQALGADFAVLGPVAATPTHPQSAGMGWAAFEQMAGEIALPVYGIGGLSPADMTLAWRHRAQGIAAIRGLWQS